MNFKHVLHWDICWILDAILLAMGQTFHQTDISFLLMYGLYTAICQRSRKVKDCRVTQKGREGWRGLKIPAHVTWASANSCSLSQCGHQKNKQRKRWPPRVHENEANREGSAQGTPCTVHGDCRPLWAAATARVGFCAVVRLTEQRSEGSIFHNSTTDPGASYTQICCFPIITASHSA